MALDAATLALTAAELKTTLIDAKIAKFLNRPGMSWSSPCAPAPIPTRCCCLPAAALHGCV